MKINNIIMGWVGLTLFFTSCSKMEDSHMEFVDGETVYRAKTDSVVAYSGKNRAKVAWELNFPTLVVKCEIREGSNVLAEIPVAYQDHLKLDYIIEGLDEKSHTLSLYSLDAAGNSSIKSDVIVEVFGDRYIKTLKTTRSIQDVVRMADNKSVALVTLSTPTSTKIAQTELFYQSTSGVEKSIRLLGTENKIELQDVAVDSDFKIADLWRPNSKAIDLFTAPAKEYKQKETPQKSLRQFNSIYRYGTTVYATLSPSAPNTKESIIRYDGKEFIVASNVNSVQIDDVSATATLSLITYIQEANNDKLYATSPIEVAVKELLEKVAMSKWKVIDFSSQQESGEGASGGHATHAIDDNLATFWHTQYSPAAPVYPHHITVNINESVTIKAIAVARRSGNSNFPALIRLEVSMDGTTWELAEEFSPVNTVNNLQRFSLAKPVAATHFKLIALRSATSSTFTCMSEINLYK